MDFSFLQRYDVITLRSAGNAVWYTLYVGILQKGTAINVSKKHEQNSRFLFDECAVLVKSDLIGSRLKYYDCSSIALISGWLKGLKDK